MKDKSVILLDMDGTIIDASESIIQTAREAMRRFGVEPDPSDDMRHLIGPPIMETFKGVYHLEEETARQITAVYRELYGREGVLNCTVYEGMPELIRALRGQGRRVLMATSKPAVYARQILEHIGLLEHFEAIGGPGLSGDHTKADMIRMALAEAEVTDLGSAVQIGDRYFDVEGAKEVGIDCIGVLYGFGSREELVGAGATCIVESVRELAELLGVPV